MGGFVNHTGGICIPMSCRWGADGLICPHHRFAIFSFLSICQFHLILGFLPLLDSWSNNIFRAILVIWSNLDSLGYCIRYSNRKMVLKVLYFNQNLFWSTYLIFGPIENTINLEFHGNGDICFVCCQFCLPSELNNSKSGRPRNQCVPLFPSLPVTQFKL